MKFQVGEVVSLFLCVVKDRRLRAEMLATVEVLLNTPDDEISSAIFHLHHFVFLFVKSFAAHALWFVVGRTRLDFALAREQLCTPQ